MSDSKSENGSLKSNPSQSSNLLPSGGLLHPPSEGGSFLAMTDDGGKELAREVSEHLSRAGAEARELAAKAKAIAGEYAPEAKEKLQTLGKEAADATDRIVARTKEKIAETSETLADPEKRRVAIAANRKRIAIGVGVVGVLLIGGWLYGCHAAAAIAKEKVDGFLIKTNLNNQFTYGEISATPFGSITISDAKIVVSPGTIVKIGSVGISDLKIKGEIPQRFSLSLKSAEIPVLAMARAQRDATFNEAIGLGYTNVTADFQISAGFDDTNGTLNLETDGAVHDAGGWKFKLEFGGINPQILAVLGALGNDSKQNPAGLFGMADQVVAMLGNLSLNQADFSIDNAGYFKRVSAITDKDFPSDTDSSSASFNPAVDQAELIRAGMSPSDAETARNAVQNWVKKGGTLRVATNLNGPLKLFQGSVMAPAFNGWPGFVAAAHLKITN